MNLSDVLINLKMLLTNSYFSLYENCLKYAIFWNAFISSNDVSNEKIGFDSDFNEVSIFYKNKNFEKLKYKPKSEISDEVVEKIINHLN